MLACPIPFFCNVNIHILFRNVFDRRHLWLKPFVTVINSWADRTDSGKYEHSLINPTVGSISSWVILSFVRSLLSFLLFFTLYSNKMRFLKSENKTGRLLTNLEVDAPTFAVSSKKIIKICPWLAGLHTPKI